LFSKTTYILVYIYLVENVICFGPKFRYYIVYLILCLHKKQERHHATNFEYLPSIIKNQEFRVSCNQFLEP